MAPITTTYKFLFFILVLAVTILIITLNAYANTIIQCDCLDGRSSLLNFKEPITSSPEPSTHDFDYNWTILLTVNEGYRDFLTNWWWHFKRHGINVPVIIEAEDDIVFTKLQEDFHPDYRSALSIERSSMVSHAEAAYHGTDAYKRLVSARPTHILKYLNKGINVLYSDIDSVWLKNPFPYFNGDYDMWLEQEDGKIYCTGFMAIKANNRTINLLKDWEQGLNKTLQIDQPLFNKLLKRNIHSIQVKPLNETLFPPGLTYKKFNEQQRTRVVVMHNTFVLGHLNKLERFKHLNLWFQHP